MARSTKRQPPKRSTKKAKTDAERDPRATALARLDAFVERAAKAKAVGEKNARALLARIRRLKARIAEDFYDLALCLHELRSKRYWAVLGYATFEECVTKEKLFEPEGARQMVAIVTAKVSREAAVALGSYSAAYEALQLTKATPAPDTVDGLVESDATIAGTKVVGSTVEKLRAAKRAVRMEAGATAKESADLTRARKSAIAIERGLAGRAKVAADVRAEAARPAPRVIVTLDADAAAALAAWLKKPR